MSVKKKDFFGKDVADVIAQACSFFKASQEDLDIEVVGTGSTGIFGLIRKKAQIRASVRSETLSERIESEAAQDEVAAGQQTAAGKKKRPKRESAQARKDEAETVQKAGVIENDLAEPSVAPIVAEEVAVPVVESTPPQPQKRSKKSQPQRAEAVAQQVADSPVSAAVSAPAGPVASEPAPEVELAPADLEMIRSELEQLLALMGYPAQVEIESRGLAVGCRLSSEHDEFLTGEEGKTLDSIQYLMRKMIARKVAGRLRLTVDVAGFRERRLDELQDRARELAELVKVDGKTQVIPALNPSERRMVHLVLQEDKEIRSRSVGDGLFKKIFIYKPGKGKSGGGRRRPSSRSRKSKASKPTPGDGDS